MGHQLSNHKDTYPPNSPVHAPRLIPLFSQPKTVRLFLRGVAAGRFPTRLSAVPIRFRVRVCWRRGVSQQVKHRCHRTPPVTDQPRSYAFLLALQERLFDWHGRTVNIPSCALVCFEAKCMYIYDVYLYGHPSPGPADNDLPPKQAEDNSVALRLYTSVNAQNVK